MLNAVFVSKFVGEVAGAKPLIETVMAPAGAPAGASATMLAGLHDRAEAGTPANVTMLLP